MWSTITPAFNASELVDRIIAHNGITYSVIDGSEPKSGYVVSIPGHEETHSWLGAEALTAYVARNADALMVPGSHLGAWYDPSEYIWYLDTSIVVDDIHVAERLAAQWGQKAFYDVRNQVTRLVPTWLTYTPIEQGGIAP